MNYHVIISGYRSITFRTGAPKAFLYIHRRKDFKIKHFVRTYTAYIITPDYTATLNSFFLQACPQQVVAVLAVLRFQIEHSVAVARVFNYRTF